MTKNPHDTGDEARSVSEESAKAGEAWLEAFTEAMSKPTAQEIAFFERRRALGLGVGLDGNGDLVYARQSYRQ
ncbi:hypothetical protein BMG03_19195 (plasmid) [Thioclava nitratireducens]|uniref:Uncharacterized protein n=1 Tax=Thioclava nitratireducens TaxID=1915078 RepID=A0ABM6IMD7_9RHOB|nr:hypothetical protein [Thioclava nitratireducens]AQS50052.1 hypothetical protein BMG03_19195 [Thioclava nitratireducens]